MDDAQPDESKLSKKEKKALLKKRKRAGGRKGGPAASSMLRSDRCDSRSIWAHFGLTVLRWNYLRPVFD